LRKLVSGTICPDNGSLRARHLPAVFVPRSARWIPESITLFGILIVITPLCGFLFGCGCAWPWSGLVENCNYFDPFETHPCPFCEHSSLSIPLLSAIALIGLAVVRSGIFRVFHFGGSIILDSLGGLIVFMLLTLIAGSLF
jgi:hypothetical protein